MDWRKKAVSSLLFSLLWPSVALSDGPNLDTLVHRSWSTDNGLPQVSVLSILQDHNGYLWFGTQEGLTRFDGVHFDVLNQYNTQGLVGDTINTLLEDSKNRLWVGTTDAGLTVFDSGRARHLGPKSGLPTGKIWELVEDRSGTIWVAVDGGGVAKWNEEHFEIFAAEEGLGSLSVRALAVRNDGDLFVGTYGGGVYQLHNGRFNSVPLFSGNQNVEVNDLLFDSMQRLVVGTDNMGVWRLDAGGAKAIFMPPAQKHVQVRTLFKDAAGQIWLGAYGQGIYRLRGDTLVKARAPLSLQNSKVVSIFEDSEGGLWFGTTGQGAHRFFQGVVSTTSTTHGLSGKIVLGLFEDSRRQIWVGTFGQGLNLIKSGTVTSFPVQSSLGDTMVFTMAELPDKRMAIGTWGDGLILLDGDHQTQLTQKDGLVHNKLRVVRVGPKGDLWIGTNGGLSRFHDGAFENFTTLDGLGSDKVYDIHVESNGDVWVGGSNGIDVVSGQDISPLQAQGELSSSAIRAIYKDDVGTTWIGTSGGLNVLHQGVYGYVTVANGLPSNRVFSVVEDPLGFIWMSSNRGISRAAKSDLLKVSHGNATQLRVTTFDTEDGMRNVECNGSFQPSAIYTSRGKLLFSTVDGVSAIKPTGLVGAPVPDHVVVSRFIADGTSHVVNNGVELKLRAGTNKIAIHYTAPTYYKSDQVKFEYRLAGEEANWVAAGTGRVAHYGNLSPGSYRFELRALGVDGGYSQGAASLMFHIAPHVYQTNGFRVLVVLLCVFLIFVLTRLREAHHSSRRRELEGQVASRTAQVEGQKRLLETKNEELAESLEKLDRASQAELRHAKNLVVQSEKLSQLGQMVAGIGHEIANPIQLINMAAENQRDQLKELTEKLSEVFQGDEESDIAREYFCGVVSNILESNQALGVGAGRLTDLSHALRTQSRFDSQPVAGVQIADVVKEAMTLTSAKTKSFDMEVNCEGLPPLFCYRSRIGQVVTNLISNAADELSARANTLGRFQGKIEIEGRAEWRDGIEGVSLYVSDNGPGVPVEIRESIFEHFFTTKEAGVGTGLGLALCSEIVRDHGGDLAVDQNETLGGARFKLWLPLAPETLLEEFS